VKVLRGKMRYGEELNEVQHEEEMEDEGEDIKTGRKHGSMTRKGRV